MSRPVVEFLPDELIAKYKRLEDDYNKAVYRFVDLRISKGTWKAEDREKHFKEVVEVGERIMRKLFPQDYN